MHAFDALFLGLGFWLASGASKWPWRPSLVPWVALGLSSLRLGGFEQPVLLLTGAAVAPGVLPAAVLLASAEYRDLADAAATSILWLVGSGLLRALEERFEPHAARDLLAVRLLSCAVLYYALHPFGLL